MTIHLTHAAAVEDLDRLTRAVPSDIAEALGLTPYEGGDTLRHALTALRPHLPDPKADHLSHLGRIHVHVEPFGLVCVASNGVTAAMALVVRTAHHLRHVPSHCGGAAGDLRSHGAAPHHRSGAAGPVTASRLTYQPTSNTNPNTKENLMTGPEHYRAAERAIRLSEPYRAAERAIRADCLSPDVEAQVRALLALVGVVAETRDAIRELVEELRIPVDAVVADVDDPIGLVPTDPDLPGGPPASPPRFLAHRIVSVPEEVE